LSIPNDEIRDQSFEVFTLSTAIQQTNKSDGSVRKGSAKLIEGLYLFTPSVQEKEEWIFFLQNLTSLPIHVDEKIENEAKESMLESLPILKGETAKIDLEVRNYEVPLLQLRPHSLSLDEKEKETMKISTPSPTRHNRKRVKHGINSVNSPFNNSHLSLDDDEGSDAESMTSPLPKETPDDQQQQSLIGTLQKQFSFLTNIEHSSSSSPPPAENNNSASPPASSSAPFLAALGKSASNYFYLSRSGGASSEEGGIGSVGLLTPVKRKSSGGEVPEILESIDEEQKEDSEKKTSPREEKEENNNKDEENKKNETEVSFSIDSQEISPVKHVDEDEGKPPQHPQKHTNEEDDDFFQTITNASLRYETDESEDERDSSANKKTNRKDANNNNLSTNSMGADQEKNQYKRMTFIAIQQQQQNLQKSSSNDPQSSSQQQPQHSRSAYGGFSSYHSTTKESWIKHEKTSTPPNSAVGSFSLRRPPSVPVMTSYSTNATTPSSNTQFVGMIPVQSNIKPKQLIPVHDSSIPLAKRHSQMIKQCNKTHLSSISQFQLVIFLSLFLSFV
jgi:hypothetical protein